MMFLGVLAVVGLNTGGFVFSREVTTLYTPVHPQYNYVVWNWPYLILAGTSIIGIVLTLTRGIKGAAAGLAVVMIGAVFGGVRLSSYPLTYSFAIGQPSGGTPVLVEGISGAYPVLVLVAIAGCVGAVLSLNQNRLRNSLLSVQNRRTPSIGTDGATLPRSSSMVSMDFPEVKDEDLLEAMRKASLTKGQTDIASFEQSLKSTSGERTVEEFKSYLFESDPDLGCAPRLDHSDGSSGIVKIANSSPEEYVLERRRTALGSIGEEALERLDKHPEKAARLSEMAAAVRRDRSADTKNLRNRKVLEEDFEPRRESWEGKRHIIKVVAIVSIVVLGLIPLLYFVVGIVLYPGATNPVTHLRSASPAITNLPSALKYMIPAFIFLPLLSASLMVYRSFGDRRIKGGIRLNRFERKYLERLEKALDAFDVRYVPSNGSLIPRLVPIDAASIIDPVRIVLGSDASGKLVVCSECAGAGRVEKVSTRTVPNPKYERAAAEYYEARSNPGTSAAAMAGLTRNLSREFGHPTITETVKSMEKCGGCNGRGKLDATSVAEEINAIVDKLAAALLVARAKIPEINREIGDFNARINQLDSDVSYLWTLKQELEQR